VVVRPADNTCPVGVGNIPLAADHIHLAAVRSIPEAAAARSSRLSRRLDSMVEGCRKLEEAVGGMMVGARWARRIFVPL